MHTIVVLHAMAAALSMAAALHLIWLLPRRRIAPRGASMGFALCLVTLHILGWIAYPDFRVAVRFDLLQAESTQWLANIFDVKEFLSWGVLLLGAAVGVAGSRRPALERHQVRAIVAGLWFVLAVLAFNSVVGILLAGHKAL